MGSIPLLLGLAAVLLVLSPTAVEAHEVIAWGATDDVVPQAHSFDAIAICARESHSLALTDTGEVLAWGNSDHGQCDVPTEAQSHVIAIAGGESHSLALTETGKVIAWGDNLVHQCDVPGTDIIAISTGWGHSLALRSPGEVIAWGANNSGQCTVPYEARSHVIAIAAGGWHSLALTSPAAGGEVIAWGYDAYGQCDVPTEAQSGVIAIAAGFWHSLALKDTGETVVWGNDYYGQVSDAPGGTGFSAIEAGGGPLPGDQRRACHRLGLELGTPVRRSDRGVDVRHRHRRRGPPQPGAGRCAARIHREGHRLGLGRGRPGQQRSDGDRLHRYLRRAIPQPGAERRGGRRLG